MGTRHYFVVLFIVVVALSNCLINSPATAGWQTETVDSRGHVGRYTSLAFDQSGNPAISYYKDKHNNTNGNLKFTRFNGTSWDIETVDSASWNVGGYTSLAFDSSGNPGISYFSDDLQTPNPSLRYAHFNGYSWDIETVDTGEVGKFTSLAFDASDNPAISYYDASHSALKYAHFDGSSWNITTVDSNVLYANTSLAFDQSDNPAIAYSGSGAGVKYAHFNGSSWDKTNVDTGGWGTNLAFDTSGNPGISYIGNWHLGYAHFNGSSWDITTVDPILLTGSYSSLAFDASGNPAISYYYETNGDLKFAHFNGSSWDINTVDNVGDVGMDTSLAFDDATGNPTISYYNETNVDLKFTRFVPCQCDTGSPMGCISGNVTKVGTGELLAGKIVKLKRTSPKKPKVNRTAITDSSGCYNFTDLGDGTYKVEVKKCKVGGEKFKSINNGAKENDVDFVCN
ncbi:MAG: hypothetical protein HYW14_02670 [Planctomycetes bacterium]|nr:hypothetical protein [Planctomycetota bacterium]